MKLMNPLTQPRWLLHAEGAALFGVVLVAWARSGGSWWLFVLLLLAPDLSALGYLVSIPVGAATYNLVHTAVLPVVLLAIGYFSGQQLLIELALIWLGHIGMDRVAGFGLKYPTKFQDTHLQRV
jgi:Domain of unknown function (DUF4260)